MSKSSIRVARVLVAGVLTFFALAGARSAQAAVDADGDGMSDIWELVFSAQGLNPNANADGDELSNLQESLAGTNPFNAKSTLRVTKIDSGGGNIVLHWPSVAAKNYQLPPLWPASAGP